MMQEEEENRKRSACEHDEGDADASVMCTPKEQRALKLMAQAAELDPEKGVCVCV